MYKETTDSVYLFKYTVYDKLNDYIKKYFWPSKHKNALRNKHEKILNCTKHDMIMYTFDIIILVSFSSSYTVIFVCILEYFFEVQYGTRYHYRTVC